MGLIRKIDGYYFRGYIPKSLVVILNKKTYDKKLYTNNKKEAQKLIKKIKLEFDYYILGIMVKDNNKDTSLEQFINKIDSYVDNDFIYRENKLFNTPNIEIEKLHENGYFYETIEALQEAVGNNNFTFLIDFEAELERAIGEHFKLVPKDKLNELKYYLAEKLLRNSELIREKVIQGYYNFKSTKTTKDNNTIKQNEDKQSNTKEYKLLDTYKEFREITARARKWNDDTKGKHIITQKALEYYFKNIDLNNISQKEAMDFRDTMEKLPLKWMVRKEFKDLKSFEDIIKENKKLNVRTIKQDTINRELDKIADFYRYAKNQGYTSKNPFEGIKFIIDKESIDDEKRKQFSEEELNKIFETPYYTTSLEDNIKQEPAKVLAPIIALYSGMRENELASFYREDIRYELIDNIKYYYFDINRKNNTTVKSNSSLRIIPIHKKIIELGFLKYIEQFKDGEHIYPHLRKYNLNKDEDKDEAVGRYSKDLANWFGYLKKTQFKRFLQDPELKVFHSFRHNFSNKLAENGTTIEDRKRLLGHHSDNRMTQLYTQYNFLKELTNIVNTIEYNVPTLDIVLEKISKNLV